MSLVKYGCAKESFADGEIEVARKNLPTKIRDGMTLLIYALLYLVAFCPNFINQPWPSLVKGKLFYFLDADLVAIVRFPDTP